jgi:hypothetical protein
MRAALRMLLAGSVVLAACQETTEPTVAPDAARVPVQIAGSDEQSTLGREIPAFGGMYLDESGRPVVHVTDLSQADRVRARLAGFAQAHGFTTADIVVLEASNSYAALEDAFSRATHAAMPLSGAVFTDLDEVENKIVVGVDNAARIGGVRAALAGAGLAAGTYDVIVTDPIHQAATLRSKYDPTMGGLQIHFSQYVCTLGMNSNDGTERSFITNSHCTATQGGVESTKYYQPTSSVDPTVIAIEVEDPQYFKNGACPKGKKCRYSDSARARYEAARGSSLGKIALTDGVNSGSLNVAGTASVVGKSNNVTVGTVVNKVGRTTGWTQAPVSRTCVNTSVSGSQIMQLCQHWVQSSSAAIVGGGDSGSSVWTGSGNVTIVGLLWGGSSDNKTFIFSPIGQVEQELGVQQVN